MKTYIAPRTEFIFLHGRDVLENTGSFLVNSTETDQQMEGRQMTNFDVNWDSDFKDNNWE